MQVIIIVDEKINLAGFLAGYGKGFGGLLAGFLIIFNEGSWQ